MQKKLWVVFGVFCILSVILIFRLMYINARSGDKYEKIVLAQQNYSSRTIPFRRGDIVDSKGTVLATSVDVYNVILDCRQLHSAAKIEDKKKPGSGDAMIDETVSAVTSHFPEITEEEMRTALKDKADSQYVVLAKQVSYDEMKSMKEVIDQDDSNVVGIWFEKEYVRQYPYNNLAASVIGFASAGSSGTIGLENEYNSVLNGTNGRSYGYVNADNDVENTVVDAKDGDTVVSTIDVNIQSIVEQSIQDFNNSMIAARAKEQGLAEGSTDIAGPNEGSLHTAVIVMNPNNGAILAMADYPGFDLNNPRNLHSLYNDDEIAAMTDEQQLDTLNDLWNNFAVSSTYEPGSTFKPFTVAAGLDSGKVKGDETYFCDGGEQIGPNYVRCIKTDGHGQENITQVLENSCNDAMMQMNFAIGPDIFSDYQHRFNFGKKTGIDLPGETRTNTLIYTKDQLKKSDVSLATNAFGQNFNVTMIQMVSGFCSLINGGYYYKPHVVSEIQDADGNTVRTMGPVLLKKTISSETSEMIKGYLKAVVTDGSGKHAAVENYSIGGKTGTAEKIPRGQNNYLVSFIGAAPIEDPQVVVYCIVDEPNTDDQPHSSFAQSITQSIMTQILPYLDVPTIDSQAQAAAEAAAAEAAKSGVSSEPQDEAAAPTDTPAAMPDQQ